MEKLKNMLDEVTVSKIATLNDAFRKAGIGYMLTGGVQTVTNLMGLLQAIKDYDNFNEDNDPYGEHDFGRIDWHGDRVFWKIDYYNRGYTAGEDPLATDCKRVLTVMLANEY